MAQMAFFLRFRPQLQRTQPEQISALENNITKAIQEANGKITRDRYLLMASFNENSLGFWIDMLILLETLLHTMEQAAGDLYGYSILVGKSMPNSTSHLCRYLTGGYRGGGIFLDRPAAALLKPYIQTEELFEKGQKLYEAESFVRLKELKIYIPSARASLPLRETLTSLPGWEQYPSVLVAGKTLEGKRDDIYRCAAGLVNNKNEIPPLVIRFGSGGLNAVIDSFTGELCAILPPDSDEVKASWEFLFRERLKEIPSAFAIRTCRKFLNSLLTQLGNLAQNTGTRLIIIVENIQLAEPEAADIVIEALAGRQEFIILGTCTCEIESVDLSKWKPVFIRFLKAKTEADTYKRLPELPPELLEFGYVCSLLGQYFPPDMIPKLLEEAGKKPAMISKSLSLLYALKVIDTPLDPRPWHKKFKAQAETALGDKRWEFRLMVRNLLLSLVQQKKINPCYKLLEILAELGGAEDINDSLILRSIHSELSGSDEASFKKAVNGMLLEAIAGPERAPAIRYITESLDTLHFGNGKAIHAIQTAPDCTSFPLLKASVLIIQSLYYLGIRDNDSAMETAKEAALIGQGTGDPRHSQEYRLLALASLPGRRIGETIDYLGFALENAAKSGDSQDIGITAYYAASVQLLYGNLSRAKTIAEKARRHFLGAGMPDWADRTRFLEGRIDFELGSYQEAIDCFEGIASNPEDGISPEKSSLLEAWIYRSKVCYQNPLWPKPQNSCPDTDLFELEAMCLAGDYQRAAELAGKLTGPPAIENFFFTEKPDWRSGFAQSELLYFSWAELWNRMLSIYQSMALSKVAPDSSHSGGEEAIRTMQRLLRSGQFPEIDPCDAFYHYAWYRVLDQTGAEQVDISTAVSIAYKRLQSRAGRIDDMEIRRQYLLQPRWNKALSQAAKEFKLI